MQAVTEMQVMELMLNRCDSMLERQTQSSLTLVKNTTKERTRTRYAPEKPFLASHDDSAKTLVLNLICKQTGGDNVKATVCVIHLKQIMCTSRDLPAEIGSPFFVLFLQLIFTLHLSIKHHKEA